MKSILQLPSESSETMMIKTFGSDVRVAIKTNDGENLELPLLTVPLICEPLIGQPLSYRGVGALDQMVWLINIHIRVVEILLWHPSS